MELSEILDKYSELKIISKIRSAHNDLLKSYKNSSGSSRINIRLTIDCIMETLNELEEEFPVYENPHLWI